MFVAVHIVDLCALVLIVFSFHRGLKRGALLAGLGILRIVCAYMGAYRFAGVMGRYFQDHYSLANTVATLIGGLLVFWTIYLAFAILMGLIERSRKRRRRDGQEPSHSPASRFFGALCGAAMAVVSIVLLCWMYSLVRASDWGGRLPDISESTSMRWSKALVFRGAYLALQNRTNDEERATRLARLISEPDETTGRLRKIAHDSSVVRLLQSQTFGDDFLSGNEDRILENQDFRQLLHDDAAMHTLGELGLLPDKHMTEMDQRELARELAKIGGHAEEVLHDPEVVRSLEELKKEGLLEQETLPQLLLDSRFHVILDRIMAEKQEPPKPRMSPDYLSERPSPHEETPPPEISR